MMGRWAPQLFRQWRSDDRGSTAIEFSIAGAVAIAILFAVVDIGRTYIVNSLLSDAARLISRENQVRITPYTPSEFTANATVKIASRAAGFLDPVQVAIVTSVYDSFEDLANNVKATGAPLGGAPGQIVKYRLTYDMDFYTPIVGLLLDAAEFNHVVEMIVYNEPGAPDL